MKVTASVKNVRISPRKARLVVDQVRGLSVEKAEQVLTVMNKKSAEPVLKLIRSAAANAVHNNKLERSSLKVSEISVDEGFTIKRYRPRAYGRAAMIRKRTCKMNVVLTGTEAAKAAPKKKETEAKPDTKKEEKKAPAKKKSTKKPAAQKKTAKKETKKDNK